LRTVSTKKILLSVFVTGGPNFFERTTNINELYKTELLPLLDKDDKREARLSIQYGLRKQFLRSCNIPDDIKLINEKLFKEEMVGSGMTEYITIGKLQMRSNNNNQIPNLKSQTLRKIYVIFY
jgi:hypothetical protein